MAENGIVAYPYKTIRPNEGVYRSSTHKRRGATATLEDMVAEEIWIGNDALTFHD